MVDISDPISFANQRHLWDEMTVTWTSGYNIDEATPITEWGRKEQNKKLSPAGTLTFTRSSMCGAPERTIGWRDPGFFHTSFFKELWPNTMTGLVAAYYHIWRHGKGSLITTDQLVADLDNYSVPYRRFAICKWISFTMGSIYSTSPSHFISKTIYNCKVLNRLWNVPLVHSGLRARLARGKVQNILTDSSFGCDIEQIGTVNGMIHVVVGGGRSHLSHFPEINTIWSLYIDPDWGFVKLTAFNHSSLLLEYKKSIDGQVYDNFTISRDYRDVLACVHDCEATTWAI
ncbi:Iron/zinc purple acid phosphatase-like C-terminal domain-containing protein [Artemisia annua]|uniref:Iron/zinc purple acid phosphatase-like C-terminal domain-containing protein n=1 Tax=Artemisia annua TaxID=35608 RepID=A0A2U1PVN6_ARTAN|nr:Iron/zinc purple acid phosphatase-like C-terminal domain-containing protein [Artemisia annua]